MAKLKNSLQQPLVACAGIALKAVATAIGIEIKQELLKQRATLTSRVP